MSVAFVVSQSYGKQDIYGALTLEDIALETLRVAKLTAKQRECLHLVVLRKSSKEIARILDISKPAVDQRLVGARRVLGAATRDEAALIYARASGTYDRILYDPVGVPSDDVFGSQGNRDERSTSVMLEEIPTTYDVDISDETDFWSQIQKEPGRALGTGQRIAIIVVLTIGILAIVLIGLSVSQSLSSLLAA
ncbi:helix-turn-helix transcriptional regulator [Parasphingorhabdus flavimaris]|uniref:helix-turn-helix transcriptional regulator n=1 Tax=Parasphingorhabdus flavimaris TaxID=266812 RepID=UPI0031B584A0